MLSVTPLFAVRYPPFCCPLPPFLLSVTPLFLFSPNGAKNSNSEKERVACPDPTLSPLLCICFFLLRGLALLPLFCLFYPFRFPLKSGGLVRVLFPVYFYQKAYKILLITGGTGSFGNAVMKRFLHTDIKEIRIFSRDEKKQDDMRRLYKNDKLKFYIGDVRDINSVKNAMYGVDYIFHAAALKQVPSCEFFPLEAVKTNILGTDNVLTAAIEYGVKKVICLSTDKAAYPINAMGISKAMMEKVFIAKSKTVDPDKTLICGTRYGNVMASRGSVIPLFIEQIKSGQPLTVTDPNMTRFLMSLEEAVELVIFAFL